MTSFNLLYLPQEIILYIRKSITNVILILILTVPILVSFLDLPDLAALSKLNSYLALLVADPVLHLTRLRVVAPSRIDHSLFARSPQGILLRPTIFDLAHRNVIRGHNIERKLRMGLYIYTPHVRTPHPFINQLPHC
jgi:hypothetical protein